MSNPYAQVAWTYYRHIRTAGRLWALISIVILYVTFSVFVVCHADMAMLMVPTLLLPMPCLVNHIKDQFLHANAHLMPGYRRAHVTVAVGAVLIVTVVIPFFLAFPFGSRSISILACSTLLFSVCLWTYFGKIFQTLFLPVYVVSLCTNPGQLFFKEFFTGKHELFACGLALFGLASSAWGLAKLFRLTEDDPYYQKLESKSGKTGQNLNTVPWFAKGWADRLADRHIVRLANHARQASNSAWSRVCRWQLGFNVALFLRTCGIIFWIAFFAYIANPNHDRAAPLLLIALFANIIPVLLVAMIQPHRPNREVLLPVDRASYIRQIGLSTLFIFIAGWVVSWSIFLLITKFYQPSVSFDIVVNLLLIAAFTYILFLGIVARMSLCRSMVWRIGSIALPYVLQMALMLPASEKCTSSLALAMVLIAAVAAAIGLFLTYDAYRRWLVADLD